MHATMLQLLQGHIKMKDHTFNTFKWLPKGRRRKRELEGYEKEGRILPNKEGGPGNEEYD